MFPCGEHQADRRARLKDRLEVLMPVMQKAQTLLFFLSAAIFPPDGRVFRWKKLSTRSIPVASARVVFVCLGTACYKKHLAKFFKIEDWHHQSGEIQDGKFWILADVSCLGTSFCRDD